MMPFDVLVEKSRSGRKLAPVPEDFFILSFDPGETTGWCSFRHTELRGFGQISTEDMGYGMHCFMELIDTLSPDLIVVEDYKVYSTHLKQHEWSELLTPKLVGLLEGIAAQHKIPVVKQMAGRAKAFVTDDKLQTWKFYKSGQRHARDAIRHACFFLAFGEIPFHDTENKSPKFEPKR